jgi:O-antigen/teichoic acid export membrane protein
VLSPGETGAFFAAVKTASMLTFPLQAVNLVVAPLLSRHFAAGEVHRVQRLANFSASVSGLTALAGCVVIALFGDLILGVFDPSYASAQLALLVLGGGYLISAVCGTSNNLMTMTGHERVHARILLVSNVTAILLTAVLSAVLGVLGAALGLAFGLGARNLWLSVWARRHMGVDPSLLGLVLPPRRHEAAPSVASSSSATSAPAGTSDEDPD